MVQETFLIGHLLQGVAYWNSGRFLEGGLLEGGACWNSRRLLEGALIAWVLIGMMGAYWMVAYWNRDACWKSRL